MCNLNLAIHRDDLPYSELNQWMSVASWNSWMNGNDDGEGYFGWNATKFFLDRNVKKIRYHQLEPFRFLVTHQRLTTSGQGHNNLHPHESKSFVLMHNGIFSGKGTPEKSDTKQYLELLERTYADEQDVLRTVKKTNSMISGSYSIILYHKESEKVYYYKEPTTNMFQLLSHQWFFLSTSKNNLELAKKMFGITAKIHPVKDGVLYEVTSDGLLKTGRFAVTTKKVITIRDGWEDAHYWGGKYYQRQSGAGYWDNYSTTTPSQVKKKGLAIPDYDESFRDPFNVGEERGV